MDGRDEEGSQEENPPRGVAAYSSILPSMPSGDGDSQDLQPVAPQAVRLPQILMPGDSAYEQFGSSARPILPSSLPMGHPSYSDPTTRSGTYSTLPPFVASMATVMPSAGGILPSASHIGHSAYSPSPPTTGPGTYAKLPPFPPFNASSATVMAAGPSFPGYGSYQSPEYMYGSGGQGYSYDANSAMPHASFGGMTGYHTAYPPPQAPDGVGYGGMGSYSAYGAQSYSYLGGGEYPKEYEDQPTQGTYGVPRKGRGHQLGPPRSFARNPGRPIVNSDNRENPGGVTLFVFYIPNDMTNHDLYELFRVHGNILSVSIKTEDDTGRGKGFGFVSFESAESAASAIKHLNGYQIHGKRLKVDYKKTKREEKNSQDYYRHNQSHPGHLPHQDFATPYEPPPLNYHQPPVSDFMPIQELVEGEDFGAKLDAEGSNPAHEVRLPQSREHEVHKPVLPPFESDVDSYDIEQRNTVSSSAPFADLTDIGTALPDTEN